LSLAFVVAPAWGQPPEAPGIVRSLAEIRHERVVIQRWDTSCGAAALATLLTYDLGDPVSERAVASGMLRQTNPDRVRVRGGFSLLDMQQFAERRGYRADGYGEMTIAHLPPMLPAIVPLHVNGYDHFVVVRAIDGEQVAFADPAFGKRRMRVAKFDRAWVQKVAFVVTRDTQ
jgi:predicted double-glycine peptidase